MKVNDKRLLYVDTAPQKEQIDTTIAKISAYREALTITKQFLEVNNLEAFERGFVAHFIGEFKDQLSPQFPKVMKLKAQMSSTGVNLERLQELEQEFNSLDGDFDRATLEPKIDDFGIYATKKEELQRLEQAEQFIKACYKFQNTADMMGGLISKGTNGAVIVDLAKQKLVVNPNWVLGLLGQPFDVSNQSPM